MHQLQIWALALIVGKKHGQNQTWPKETAHPSYRHGALGGHTEGANEETGGIQCFSGGCEPDNEQDPGHQCPWLVGPRQFHPEADGCQ